MSTGASPASPAGTDVAATAAAESSPAPSETVISQNGQPAGEPTTTKELTPSEKLRLRLTGEQPQPPAPPETVAPAKAEAPNPDTTETLPPPKPEAEPPKAETIPAEEVKPNQNTRLSDDEWKQLSLKTRARISDLDKENKDLRKEVDELKAGTDDVVVGNGEYVTDLMDRLKMTPENFHKSMVLFEGFCTAKEWAYESMIESVRQLASVLKKPDPFQAASPSAVTPFRGELDGRFQEMIGVLGFSEQEARIACAAIAQRGQPAAPLSPPPAPTSPAAGQLPAPSVRTAEPETRANASKEFEERAHAEAGNAVIAYLAQQGIPAKATRQHIEQNLWPYLKQLSPNQVPAQLAPANKLQAVEIAQQRWLLDQAAKRTKPPASGPGTLASSTAPPLQQPPRAPEKPLTPSEKLRRRMVAS